MKKIKAILVDDEEPARISLQKLLEWYAPDVDVVALCDGVESASKAIAAHQPDLVFLDIQMPVRNGFDLLREIDVLDFDVIFVTAFDEFAVEAFKHHATAYLLKPIDEDELKQAMERVRKSFLSSLNTDKLLDLFTMIKEFKPSFKKIAIPTMEGLELVNIDSIMQCEAEGNYTYIHRTDESPLLVSKSLKFFENQLADHHQFLRVHHSHIVNLEFVKRYIKGKGGCLILENNNAVPVSRNRKDDVLSNF